MEYKRFGNKVIARIDKGEEIVASVKEICEKNNIRLGSITGIGAVNKASIGLFETATKQYFIKELEGEMEIPCIVGNISQKNGEIYLHLHVTLADKTFQAYGGHLNYAHVSAISEIVIDIFEGTLERTFNEELGLNSLSF